MRLSRLSILVALLSAGLSWTPVARLAAQTPEAVDSSVPQPRRGDDVPPPPFRPDDQRRDAPWKPYADVTRHAEVRGGLFVTYLRRDNVLLGIRPAQFDRDYLLVTQLSQGIGEAGIDGGTSVRGDMVRFHRTGDRVELWVVNSRIAAPAGTPLGRTVGYSFGHSVAQSFPIATMRDTSEILIDVTPFLVSDWADLGSILAGLAAQKRLPVAPAFDRDRSSLGTVQTFPTNVEAEVHLTYQSPRNLGLETLSDYRWIPVGVHYSFVELPARPMRPRYADDRVGYFITAFKDFSRDTAESYFVRYVNRWRLEKRDPAAKVSDPVRPITYYIDRTVPVEWRPYIGAGVLEWNKAFESIGFRNAIQVLDAPDDSLWNAEDARYSTIRWTATNRSVYAVGPSAVDPRTGEILNADVLISAAWIPAWRGELTDYVAPHSAISAAFADDSLLHSGDVDASHLCRAGEGLAREGAAVRALLAATGRLPAGAAMPKEYVGAALKQLVMHEIGHTLGLRHNFRGSAGVSLAQLGDRTYTSVHGVAASVMDYLPPSLAADPKRQGDYYSSTIGSYDRWAIAYGYAPVTHPPAESGKGGDAALNLWTPDYEANALRVVAAQAGEPGHLYATDEDASLGALGLDPTVSRYDLGDDPLAWARERVTLIRTLADSLDLRLVAQGEGWQRLRSGLGTLLADRFYATLVAAKYVGGAYTNRDHRGDPGARVAVTPVPAERQHEALAFVTDAIFGKQAWRFRPELLARLAPDRWSHWGSNPAAQRRIDFPLHDWAETQQAALLNVLFDPAVLDRIRDNEARMPDSTAAFTLPDLFSTMTKSIWAEVFQPAKRGTRAANAHPLGIDAFRRDGQRQYLSALLRLVTAPASGTPDDARALARVELGELATTIDRVLARPAQPDAYTRAHLLDSRERIRQTLDTPLPQNTAPAR